MSKGLKVLPDLKREQQLQKYARGRYDEDIDLNQSPAPASPQLSRILSNLPGHKSIERNQSFPELKTFKDLNQKKRMLEKIKSEYALGTAVNVSRIRK